MTKLQMLAEIYAHLSRYYGLELNPTNRILNMPKAKINFLYNVYLVNKTFVGDDIRTIESNLKVQSEN
jgi:hypothetical protein